MFKNILIVFLLIVVVGCVFFGLTTLIRNLLGLSNQSIFDIIFSGFKVKI